MERVILLRFGEIFLKGKNKSYFESVLIRNIKSALDGFEFAFARTQNRYYIEAYDLRREGVIIDKLTKVFGLHSLSVAVKVESDLTKIEEAVELFAPPQATTFRMCVKRADKKFPLNSLQIACEIGGVMLEKHPYLSVDLHKPNCEIFVDIRERGYSYVFRDNIACAQGMPVGTSGRGLLLLSGGFDSPVAGWRMARRGMEISAIHFHSYPHTSLQAKQKVVDLAKALEPYCGRIKLYAVPFTAIQEAIHFNCRADFMITVMRRIMVEIAERVAIENSCGALITGESLAQVASQTTQSITVTNEAVKLLPIFRPLIGMDKYEIMDCAEKIGTYKISELPFEDCCTVFLPKNPVIKPALETAKREQARIADLPQLIEQAIADIEVIEL